MPAPDVQRTDPPLIADERRMLEAWLEYHRATLLLKCSNLDDSQLKLRAAAPSVLSLLGLVRHMTDVERTWFVRRLAGQTGPGSERIYRTPERRDADFEDVDTANVEAAFAGYVEELERCRAASADVPLDTIVGDRSVRWIYVHMIEEYARHNGHADILRERIDGSRGV